MLSIVVWCQLPTWTQYMIHSYIEPNLIAVSRAVVQDLMPIDADRCRSVTNRLFRLVQRTGYNPDSAYWIQS
jgi:hypothetical protein